MVFFRRKKKKRACVVGLDGVPYSLVMRFIQDGTMPALARIVEGGQLRRMKASLPEISAVSWSSFMAGANPGTHGIFGFTDLRPGSYRISFPSFKDLKVPTIWDKLGEKDKRCIVVNQPATYPARPINGVLVSGFVAIDIAKAVAPPSRRQDLERLGYRIDVDTQRSREDHDFFLKELDRTLSGRVSAVDYLWEKETWDYFQVVITGTDRLHHFLWNALEDESHPHHTAFLDYYRKIDGFIDQLYRRFGELSGQDEPLEGFFLLSDHGFTGIQREVYLNAWLKREGYLEFDRVQPESLEDISATSRAFALDPSRIYLNLKGKYPRGCVEPSEADSLRKELKAKLKEITFDGLKVVEDVLDGVQVYSGPFTQHGPDLVVLSRAGFDLKGSVKREEIFTTTNLQGMHTWDDAFFWSAGEVKDDLCITDVASIILSSMGC